MINYFEECDETQPATCFECSANHLILVDEGIQCSNCLVLVVDNRNIKTEEGD